MLTGREAKQSAFHTPCMVVAQASLLRPAQRASGLASIMPIGWYSHHAKLAPVCLRGTCLCSRCILKRRCPFLLYRFRRKYKNRCAIDMKIKHSLHLHPCDEHNARARRLILTVHLRRAYDTAHIVSPPPIVGIAIADQMDSAIGHYRDWANGFGDVILDWVRDGLDTTLTKV